MWPNWTAAHNTPLQTDERAAGYGCLRDDLTDRVQIGIHELRFQQQVFGRISHQCQFRESHDIRIGLPRAIGPPEDFHGVPVNIAGNHIDLRHGHSQGKGSVAHEEQ